ncbi:hypothetical protein SAMN04489732_10242 [Amycolatopsis saalfeldensis]|uniref:Uncharacterized protein n=1 Tax=Amycolatopsis saalfeldensis TaxID=394193 RepID=A0A1H8SD07_9PSEU|nr:hypothetical protein SAMN04489732_10242 [Amycolatopsis saalfeldensis]
MVSTGAVTATARAVRTGSPAWGTGAPGGEGGGVKRSRESMWCQRFTSRYSTRQLPAQATAASAGNQVRVVMASA